MSRRPTRRRFIVARGKTRLWARNAYNPVRVIGDRELGRGDRRPRFRLHTREFIARGRTTIDDSGQAASRRDPPEVGREKRRKFSPPK